VYREILNPEDNRWYGSTITLVGQGAQGPARLVVFRDISERKQQEEETRRLAYYDALTGLPNRVLFADRLQKALAWARRHRQKGALLLLDLDRFKTVNDTRGHKMGDLLLREVGARLLAVLRQTDTIARFGGDEFLLLFSEIGGQEDVLTVAARIAAVFQRPFACAGEEVRITASLGCVVFPDDGEDADLLMQRADQAMYRAKRKGRKPPVFTKAPSASPTSAGRLSPGGHDSR
jgi:diguanylate cyclase (GGDEF)-like protein